GTGTCFCKLDELFDVTYRKFWVGQQDILQTDVLRERCEIAERVEGQVIQAGVDCSGWRDQHNGMSIGLGHGRGVHPDVASGTRFVLDNDALADTLTEALGNNASYRVRWTSRRKRNDDLQGPGQVVLGFLCLQWLQR